MFSKFFKHQPVAANTEEKVHLNVQSDLESSENNMVLRTEDLVKKYRQRTVVNHVSIDVTQGEMVGLLGPNGAGKTTTFYMTTGLITPNQGHIYLNDLDITDYPVYNGRKSVSDIWRKRLRCFASCRWKIISGVSWK